jgi:hypothetical protein
VDRRPNPGKVYDLSYKNGGSAAESVQSVRFIVQKRWIGGRNRSKCTIYRTKTVDRQPKPFKVYDLSYKNGGPAAESVQSVRYIVQKRWIGGRIRVKCTIYRTKTVDRQPNPFKVYDLSYKNGGSAAETVQSVRFIVQKRWIGSRNRSKCTIYRTKTMNRPPNPSKMYDLFISH